MADEDLVVRAALRDELSGPLNDIRDELRQLGDQADKTDRQTRNAGGGLDRLGGAAKRMGGGVGRIGVSALKGAAVGAAALAAAAGVAAGAAVTLGVKTAANMETARISFETMLGSGKKADSFLRDLSAFAAKTPFEFPELQTAASSLVSAGINADKVIPIMTTLGDVTSGMGTGSEGVQRATVALQQMSAAGKITGEDLNQLRDAGVPVFDLLAKATGKSKAEVAGLAQAGKLGSKELGQMMTALESGKGLERFSGLMEKQSASLSGQWSTLKDTVTMGLAGAVQPALPAIKSGLASISAAATSAFGWVADNRDSIASLVNVAGSSLRTFGSIAKAALGGFSDSISNGKGAFETFANFVATHQADITGFIVAGVKGFASFGLGLAMLVSGSLRGLASLANGIADFVDNSYREFGTVLDAATAAFSWIPGIGPKLAGARDQFKAFAARVAVDNNQTGDQLNGMADKIDNGLVPALKAARDGADKLGKTEAVKAQQRDAAARAAIAIGDIGTKADGAQVKLKTFADRTKLGADQQAALAHRLGAAKTALGDQLGAMQAAGSGQDALTKTWQAGKDKLRDEFVQMGLSKTEAGKLAAKYAGIKPKVLTKFDADTAAAKAKADDLKRTIDGVKSKAVTLTVHQNGSFNVGALQGTIGDTRTSHAAGGGLAGTMAGHAAAMGASSARPRITNIGVGGGGTGRGSGDHQAGRALDLTGSGLPGYAAAIRRGGGFAEMHGHGRRRHLHAVPGQAGDTYTSKARRATLPAGSGGGTTLVVSPGAIRVDASGSSMDAEQIAAAVQRGIADYVRDQAERG